MKPDNIKRQQDPVPQKKKSTERKLDKELEMTFPASDPPTIIQPKPHKNVVQKN